MLCSATGSELVALILIRQKVIYPMDSAINPFNNQGQDFKLAGGYFMSI